MQMPALLPSQLATPLLLLNILSTMEEKVFRSPAFLRSQTTLPLCVCLCDNEGEQHHKGESRGGDLTLVKTHTHSRGGVEISGGLRNEGDRGGLLKKML